MIDTIKIKEVVYPVRISHRAIKSWRILKNRDIDTLGSEPGDLEQLLFEGIRWGARVEKKTIKLTIDDIDEWLDEDMVGHMEIISRLIENQFPNTGEADTLTIEQIYKWAKADKSNTDKLIALTGGGALLDELPEDLKNG